MMDGEELAKRIDAWRRKQKTQPAERKIDTIRKCEKRGRIALMNVGNFGRLQTRRK